MAIALLDIHQDELMLLSMEDMLKVCYNQSTSFILTPKRLSNQHVDVNGKHLRQLLVISLSGILFLHFSQGDILFFNSKKEKK